MADIKKILKYGYVEMSGNESDIWFISDCHFFHENIIRLAGRPFANADEMTETLINNWNEVVKPDDFVFNLGDFCWSGDYNVWERLIGRLNGKQFLILGNHDQRKVVVKIQNLFVDIRERVELRHDEKRFMLDHFPQYEWNGSYHHVRHLHGHIHEKDSDIAKTTSYNVSVERNNYRPVSLQEINILFENQSKYGIKNLTLNAIL
jgi:calcineurin-like phosphoesterase family protein